MYMHQLNLNGSSWLSYHSPVHPWIPQVPRIWSHRPDLTSGTGKLTNCLLNLLRGWRKGYIGFTSCGKTAVGLWWDLPRGSCIVSDTDSWSTQRRPRSAVSWCLMYLDKPFSLLRPFGSKVVSSLCNSAQVALLWLKPWPVEISEPAHWAGVTWISLPETNMAPGV